MQDVSYTIDKGEKGIRQGMSGGAIFDSQGNFLGINTVGIAPILPNYTYNDGSKPIAKLKDLYARANWGIPVYNFLTNVKADILYGYDNLPKVEHQVTPTGYMAKLNDKARKMTVRIENNGSTGSGVIVAREGSTYYVLTAKHVLRDEDGNAPTHQSYTNNQIITYDQDVHPVTSTVVAEGVDLAVVKFTSTNNYPIAQLGEYSQNDNDLTFVGGFPNRGDIKSPLWQWQLNPGLISSREQGKLQTQDNKSFSEGYDLIYSSISYRGMSGGPVFNTDGNVIGIHGRGEVADLNSLGMSIQTFTGLADKLHVNSKLLKIVKTSPIELNLEDRNNVIIAMQNIPKPQEKASRERWLAYGNQLFRTRQLEKAVGAFDRARGFLGNYGKALSLANIGEYNLAENEIATAIASIPSNQKTKYYYFWKYQSLIFESLEKYDEALRSIDIAIGLERSDLTLLHAKAGIFRKKKQYREEISIYDEIINIRKIPEAYHYNNRGAAKSELKNFQDAITDYNLAISLNPKFTNAYNNRGLAKSNLGNKLDAIMDYDLAISLNSKYINAYNNRGVAKSALGNKQGAIIDYNRAISLDPNDAVAYYNRGLAKSDLGRKQEAIVDFNSAISLNSKFISAYNNRGIVKSALGRKSEAIMDYDRAILLSPNDALFYYNRGLAKSDLGNHQGAITDYNRAISLDPKFASSYYSRGNAQFVLRNIQNAITDYDLAIVLDRNFAAAYNNRGAAKFALGNNQDAIIDMSKAAELHRQQGQMDLYQRTITNLAKMRKLYR